MQRRPTQPAGSSARRSRRFIAALTVPMLVLGACSDNILMPSASGPGRTGLAAGQSGQSRGIEDSYLELESRIPGFGGMFVNAEGDIQIWVAPNTDRGRAERGVRDFLSNKTGHLKGPKPRRLVLRAGRYGFGSLVAWQQAIASAATRESGIAMIDADESLNRVRVTVRTEDALHRLPVLLARARVPQRAVVAEVIDYKFEATNVLNAGINRPAAAGLQISSLISTQLNGMYYDPTIQVCTMGFNIVVSGQPYFLTASHCTTTYGGELGRLWFAPSIVYNPITGQIAINTNAYVGQTARNPAWVTTNCFGGATRCRWTDAMLVKWRNNDYAKNVYITSVIGSGNNAGNVVIGDEQLVVESMFGPSFTGGPEWPLRDPTQMPGMVVSKTGSITGTTTGPLLQTCNIIIPTNTGLGINCGNLAQMREDPGDSGAPVYYTNLFSNVPFTEGIATLKATVQAHPNDAYAVYSPWGAIMTDLGIVRLSGGALAFSSTTGGGGGPPPFTGSIVGPTDINPNMDYDWSISTQAGTAPYSYQWYVDGEPAESNESYISRSFSPYSWHSIYAEVIDAEGRYIQTAALDVHVNTGSCDPNEENCYETRKVRRGPTNSKSGSASRPPTTKRP